MSSPSPDEARSVSAFDDATTVRPVAGHQDGSDGHRWSATLDARWRIENAVNGGLLLALAGNALRHELDGDGGPAGHADPLSVSAYYLSAATPGPAQLATRTLRSGRSMSTGEVSVLQQVDGRSVERMRALATYGELTAIRAEETPAPPAPPELPPPDACVSTAQAPRELMTHSEFLDQVDLRLDPATAGWAVGKPSGLGRIRGWFRLPDGREPDPLLLLLAVDSLPPVAFDLGLSGWTPTLELTVYLRARPAPGWLRVALSTRHHAHGFLEEDAEVWDSTGRLVAQSRQLARTAPPRR